MQLCKRQAEAGDIVQLYSDESEAPTRNGPVTSVTSGPAKGGLIRRSPLPLGLNQWRITGGSSGQWRKTARSSICISGGSSAGPQANRMKRYPAIRAWKMAIRDMSYD